MCRSRFDIIYTFVKIPKCNQIRSNEISNAYVPLLDNASWYVWIGNSDLIIAIALYSISGRIDYVYD